MLRCVNLTLAMFEVIRLCLKTWWSTIVRSDLAEREQMVKMIAVVLDSDTYISIYNVQFTIYSFV